MESHGLHSRPPEHLRTWTIDLFDQLSAQSRRRHPFGTGITRETYGDGETEALETIEKAAREYGLDVFKDRAANLVVELKGAAPDLPVVACGSHLDSVPEGGNFDGAAGVIAGLLALIRCKTAEVVPPRTLRLYALRGEESAWFNKCYLGSLAMFGMLTEKDLELRHRDNGKVLRDYMRACGADVGSIGRGEALVSAEEFACFLELHIEQGPVMVDRDLPVGLVSGIRGNYRFPSARCTGRAAHSGTVPRWSRHDAVFAVAELITRLDERWRKVLERGQDLVMTVGVLHTNPKDNAMSRVPGEVTFSLEFRSRHEKTLEAFERVVRREGLAIARSRGVKFDFGAKSPTPPAEMDSRILNHLDELCSDAGFPFERLSSGAGHDAAIFAGRGIPTGMIFVRNEHGSHNPDEAMDYDDFFLAADLLARAMLTVPDAQSHEAAAAQPGPTLPRTSAASQRSTATPDSQRDAEIGRATAQILLDTQLVMVRPDQPFFFPSGWASPVFVNVKRLISFPTALEPLTEMAIEKIRRDIGYDHFDVIAGGELAGVPFATMIATRLKMPHVIVRKQAQSIEDEDRVTGDLKSGQRALLVGDLTTDGRTKRDFCESLRKAGAIVRYAFVVFKYGIYDHVARELHSTDVALSALTTWDYVLEVARERQSLETHQLDTIREYIADPVAWSKRNRGISGLGEEAEG